MRKSPRCCNEFADATGGEGGSKRGLRLGGTLLALALLISCTTDAAPRKLRVTTTSLPGATTGVYYQAQFQAVGGKPPYTWKVTSGKPPAGLSLSTSGPTAGLLSGTPTMLADSTCMPSTTIPGWFTCVVTFTVTVYDSAGASVSVAVKSTNKVKEKT